MKTILYLSPHLDDVVFSCSNHLVKQSRKGHRTIVTTVFTEGDHEHRKQEDLAALKMCGAEAHWLGYLDAPFRDKKYNNFSSITLDTSDNFSLDLKELIEQIQPDQVIAPLGVGAHVDHLLVFDAVNRLQFHNTWYYADLPYSLVNGATHLRLRQLGYNADLVSFDHFWQSFKATRYVQRYLKPEEEMRIKQSYIESWLSPRGNKPFQSLDTKYTHHPSINCYLSQLENFINTEETHSSEKLFKLS